MNIKKEEKIENPKDKISQDKIPINQNKNETQNQMKKENINKNKKVITNNNQDNNKNQNQVKKQHPYIDKNKFKKEELEDPDIIDNLVSVSVLEFKDKELESKMKKIETRIPRPLRDKSNKIKVKMNFLKNALGDNIDNVKEEKDEIINNVNLNNNIDNMDDEEKEKINNEHE